MLGMALVPMLLERAMKGNVTFMHEYMAGWGAMPVAVIKEAYLIQVGRYVNLQMMLGWNSFMIFIC